MLLRNDQGEAIKTLKVFSNPQYANPDGSPDWKQLIDADEKGFYLKARYDNGQYTKPTVLLPDTVLLRYGDMGGRFVSDDGTPYCKLSLPYKQETMEFHKYIVLRPFTVEEGLIAPGFDNLEMINLATQYFTKIAIQDLLFPREGAVLKELKGEKIWKN